jgi:nucleoside-diphosphate-sugar epimerase
MIKPRIIETGATGKTGSIIATELLKAGYPVHATEHREHGRSARLKVPGAPQMRSRLHSGSSRPHCLRPRHDRARNVRGTFRHQITSNMADCN